jgi:hypothetical protein
VRQGTIDLFSALNIAAGEVIGKLSAQHRAVDFRDHRSVQAKGDTKTRKSRRLLQMPKRAVESLKPLRKRQAAERLHAGNLWQGRKGWSPPES